MRSSPSPRLLIVLGKPTLGMINASEHYGSAVNAPTNTNVLKAQILSIEGLMAEPSVESTDGDPAVHPCRGESGLEAVPHF